MSGSTRMGQATFWCNRGMVISVQAADGTILSGEVDKPFARVGGEAASEVVLPGEGIPLRSLYLHATDDGVYCLNLDPRQDGDSAPHGWLNGSSPVCVGQYLLQATLSEEVNGVAGQVSWKVNDRASAAPPALRLESRDGSRRATYRLRRRLTLIGRLRPSKLRLHHRAVSAAHCVLFWDGHGLWTVDLLSGNGTLLNGQPIECAEVLSGDCIEVGPFLLTYVPTRRYPERSDGNRAAGELFLPASVEFGGQSGDPVWLPESTQVLDDAEPNAPENEERLKPDDGGTAELTSRLRDLEQQLCEARSQADQLQQLVDRGDTERHELERRLEATRQQYDGLQRQVEDRAARELRAANQRQAQDLYLAEQSQTERQDIERQLQEARTDCRQYELLIEEQSLAEQEWAARRRAVEIQLAELQAAAARGDSREAQLKDRCRRLLRLARQARPRTPLDEIVEGPADTALAAGGEQSAESARQASGLPQPSHAPANDVEEFQAPGRRRATTAPREATRADTFLVAQDDAFDRLLDLFEGRARASKRRKRMFNTALGVSTSILLAAALWFAWPMLVYLLTGS